MENLIGDCNFDKIMGFSYRNFVGKFDWNFNENYEKYGNFMVIFIGI